MMKSYRLDGLCCPNCADQMEEEIARLPGVKRASVNFLTGVFKLEAEAELYANIFEKSVAIMRKYERDLRVLV